MSSMGTKAMTPASDVASLGLSSLNVKGASMNTDPYAVFVNNLYADYVNEKLELGTPPSQILSLADYSSMYYTWLIQQYKEYTNG